MASRIRKCSTEKEFEQIIDDFITTGYELQNRGTDNALLIKKKPKDHVKIALLTVWWTVGLGNLVYALIPAKIEDEVLVKIVKE